MSTRRTGWTARAVSTTGGPYAGPQVASTFVVITAINAKPGDVLYWSQAFSTNPWTKELVATG